MGRSPPSDQLGSPFAEADRVITWNLSNRVYRREEIDSPTGMLTCARACGSVLGTSNLEMRWRAPSWVQI